MTDVYNIVNKYINPDLSGLIDEYSQVDWNVMLANACRNGDWKSIKFAEKNGAIRYGKGLVGACESNNLDVVKYIIGGKKDYVPDDIELGFSKACESDGLEIIQYLLEQVWDFVSQDSMILSGLLISAQKGSRRVFNNLINRDNLNISHYQWALVGYCTSGNLSGVKDMLVLMRTYDNCIKQKTYNLCLSASSLYGSLNIVKYMVEQGANNLREALDEANKGLNNIETIPTTLPNKEGCKAVISYLEEKIEF